MTVPNSAILVSILLKCCSHTELTYYCNCNKVSKSGEKMLNMIELVFINFQSESDTVVLIQDCSLNSI